MSDELTDRIADVLQTHERNRCWWHCDGGTTTAQDWHAPHVAAAVAAVVRVGEEPRG